MGNLRHVAYQTIQEKNIDLTNLAKEINVDKKELNLFLEGYNLEFNGQNARDLCESLDIDTSTIHPTYFRNQNEKSNTSFMGIQGMGMGFITKLDTVKTLKNNKPSYVYDTEKDYIDFFDKK